MAYLRIEDYVCVLCAGGVADEDLRDTNPFVFSLHTDLTPYNQCENTSSNHEEGLLVHQECLKETERLVRSISIDPPRDILATLRLLYDSRRALWPVPRSAYHSRRLLAAGDAFAEFILSRSELSGVFAAVQRLPAELIRRIGQLCSPSAMTSMCVLRKNAMQLAMMDGSKGNTNSVGFCCDMTLKPIYRTIMNDTYVSEIREDRNPRENDHKDSIIVSFDDFACTSVRESHEKDPGQARRGLWYRKFTRDRDNDLVALYKGKFVRNIISQSQLTTSYLWNHSDPPDLQPEHCFRLPAVRDDVEDLMNHPIRLRQIGLNGSVKGLIVGTLPSIGDTVAVQAYSGSSTELDVYKRMEDMNGEGNVRWFFYPIHNNEQIVEVAVRGKRGLGWSLRHESNLTLFTSRRRPINLGRYIPPEMRQYYEFHPLINDPTLEVSEIYLSERFGLRRRDLRVGVTCQPSTDHHQQQQQQHFFSSDRKNIQSKQEEQQQSQQGNEVFWDDTMEPTTKPQVNLSASRCYFSTVDVNLYNSFEICLDDGNGLDGSNRKNRRRACLGLRFHGAGGVDVVLGEWRLDKKIVKESLPTPLMLLNRRRGISSFVEIVGELLEDDDEDGDGDGDDEGSAANTPTSTSSTNTEEESNSSNNSNNGEAYDDHDDHSSSASHVTSTRIHGVLEWWVGFRGGEVYAAC